ncbi:hypothetical protein V2G26_012567 [Clonostachys chloroleuca]
MPTQHVDPSSDELLQTVANTLLKARKVVVVTGAGISTNSGIPDFRSENGLYSLIQAHFELARNNASPDTTSQGDSDTNEGDNERDFQDGPAPKRRRLSCGPIIFNRQERSDQKETEDAVALEEPAETPVQDDLNLPSSPTRTTGNAIQISTPKAMRTPDRAEMPTTSPLSSPPLEEIVLPTSPGPIIQTRSLRSRRDLLNIAIPASSSPLSSPPPILFEPHPPSPSITSSSRRSSTSQCEMDLNSHSLSASQSSSGRNSLPNMKGKDLFDASIWSDPLRTSVFYTFATSLRQKVKDCEPTSSHRFISHLRDRKKLVRCYTQNIDRIEEKVGLSTSLEEGPGSRGRFSRRSTANGAQLSKMVEDAAAEPPTPVGESHPSLSTQHPADETETPKTPVTESEASVGDQPKAPPKLETLRSSGVECVFLHGSLESLRCFLCGRVTCWDGIRESETMSGQQPECPHCVGATAAREERGKRALGVGKLRPDIVLYGEEHPNAHLISPIVTHDLSLCPDMLLILGTSLRVHGLKILVREFAKSIHSRGGTVVFVNFTKPPESSWGDIIDYWVQWDCDAWVSDLQNRVPKLWEEPKEKQPAKNPMALRDTKVTGAYWTQKIIGELRRITEFHDASTPRSSSPISDTVMAEMSITVESKLHQQQETEETIAVQASGAATPSPPPSEPAPPMPPPPPQPEPLPKASVKPSVAQNALRLRPRRTRKSAPAAMERAEKKKPPSTLNPNHGRALKQEPEPEQVAGPVLEQVLDQVLDQALDQALEPGPEKMVMELNQPTVVVQPLKVEAPPPASSSILNSVKANPRLRKRKKIYGEEEVLSSPPQNLGGGSEDSSRRSSTGSRPVPKSEPALTLPPLRVIDAASPEQLDRRPRPLEPQSPPQGPQPTLHANVRQLRSQSLAIQEAMIKNQTQIKPARGQWNDQQQNWMGEHESVSGQWEAQQRQEQFRLSRQQREELARREREHNEKEKDVALALVGLKVSALRQWGDTWHVSPNRCR